METERCRYSELPPDLAEIISRKSLFSSIGFASLWRTVGGEPVCWLTLDSDGPVAVLPGVEFGRRPVKRFQSMPNGTYGYPWFRENVDTAVVAGMLMSNLCRVGYVKIHFNDFHKCLALHPDYRPINCETTLVDISDPDWMPPDKKLRQQIRKADHEGLSVASFDPAQHLDPFMTLVDISVSRLGIKNKYPREFFVALADLAAGDERVRWLWCESEGRAVASSIFLVEGDNLLHWQVYYDDSLSHLQPNKFIPFVAARKASAEGVKFLNLGSSPPEAEGVLEYKRKWGGESYRYPCYQRLSGVGKVL